MSGRASKRVRVVSSVAKGGNSMRSRRSNSHAGTSSPGPATGTVTAAAGMTPSIGSVVPTVVSVLDPATVAGASVGILTTSVLNSTGSSLSSVGSMNGNQGATAVVLSVGGAVGSTSGTSTTSSQVVPPLVVRPLSDKEAANSWVVGLGPYGPKFFDSAVLDGDGVYGNEIRASSHPFTNPPPVINVSNLVFDPIHNFEYDTGMFGTSLLTGVGNRPECLIGLLVVFPADMRCRMPDPYSSSRTLVDTDEPKDTSIAMIGQIVGVIEVNNEWCFSLEVLFDRVKSFMVLQVAALTLRLDKNLCELGECGLYVLKASMRKGVEERMGILRFAAIYFEDLHRVLAISSSPRGHQGTDGEPRNSIFTNPSTPGTSGSTGISVVGNGLNRSVSAVTGFSLPVSPLVANASTVSRVIGPAESNAKIDSLTLLALSLGNEDLYKQIYSRSFKEAFSPSVLETLTSGVWSSVVSSHPYLQVDTVLQALLSGRFLGQLPRSLKECLPVFDGFAVLHTLTVALSLESIRVVWSKFLILLKLLCNEAGAAVYESIRTHNESVLHPSTVIDTPGAETLHPSYLVWCSRRMLHEFGKGIQKYAHPSSGPDVVCQEFLVTNANVLMLDIPKLLAEQHGWINAGFVRASTQEQLESTVGRYSDYFVYDYEAGVVYEGSPPVEVFNSRAKRSKTVATPPAASYTIPKKVKPVPAAQVAKGAAGGGKAGANMQKKKKTDGPEFCFSFMEGELLPGTSKGCTFPGKCRFTHVGVADIGSAEIRAGMKGSKKWSVALGKAIDKL